MSEFPIGARTYRSDKLDAFQQLHIVRKLAPLLTGLGGIEQLREGGAAGLMSQLGPGLEAFARLPDGDVDHVLHTCLGVVSAKLDGDLGWARIYTKGGGLQYEDIDLVVMLQIVWKVLEENLEALFFTFQRLFPAKPKDTDAKS